MNYHVQNPWTRSPSLMVNMSVEEARQLKAGLEQLKELYIRTGAHELSSYQENALNELRMLLEEKLAADRPDGLNGSAP